MIVIKRIKYYIKQVIVKGYYFLRKFLKNDNNIINKAVGKANIDVWGRGNEIIINDNVNLSNTQFYIRGNNNKIIIGTGCTIGKECSFWIEGNNASIVVGNNCTFVMRIYFNAQEDGSSIKVGDDCMFSNTIWVRTSDSHPIYSLETNQRINPPKNVEVGNHVWIAPNTKIMKGVSIADGAIIGSDTMVLHNIPKNVVAVGHPARVVKRNVYWTREHLF